MTIAFLDLKRLNQEFEKRFSELTSDVINGGWYILGPHLSRFEAAFANYCHSKYCIGTANGLDALTLLLKAQEYPPQSEIIVAANTYLATILSILHAGHKPVLVEPSIENYQLDPALVAAHITGKTKAIMVTHLYGHIGPMPRLQNIAQSHGLTLFEDAAQAHGASLGGTMAGNFGDGAGFSFYPTKNLGALGDAGAVTCNNTEVYEKISQFRNYGFISKNNAVLQGHNSRLDELQAALLLEKLTDLDKQNTKRRGIAAYYLQNIKNEQILLPPQHNVYHDAWHLFVIRCQSRDKLIAHLQKKGIETAIHYPIAPHKQQAFAELTVGALPITEQLHQEVLSIPNAPYLGKEEQDLIIEALNQYQ